MKIALFIFLVFVSALSYSITVHSQINSEIQELFGDAEEIEVIVILKDDYNVLYEYGISDYKDDFEMEKMMIAEQQEDDSEILLSIATYLNS